MGSASRLRAAVALALAAGPGVYAAAAAYLRLRQPPGLDGVAPPVVRGALALTCVAALPLVLLAYGAAPRVSKERLGGALLVALGVSALCSAVQAAALP